MIEQLRQIHALCLKHEDHGAARLVARLIDLREESPDEFWDLLSANSVWGGAGSLADQCLVESGVHQESELKQDRRVLWRALAEIAREMVSAGRVNERTEFWASAFRKWLREGL
jgi:hypothetical protein